jgi:hypothetical protein
MSEGILPPFSTKVHWKDYEIATPTFSLTPVEKPDMSPYLVHMTGKDQIAAILKGEGNEVAKQSGQGFLKASIPSQSRGNYFAEVVCFTESPTFAVDFFRYRVFKRWQDDVLYGIGFSKKLLVGKGVLPAIYLSAASTQRLVSLHKALEGQHEEFAAGSVQVKLRDFFGVLYPLCTPLLENEPTQGFSWEREWRYTELPGLLFDHTDVRVICCPDAEKDGIRELLGSHSGKVTFVRSWVEFSDVRDFLSRQESTWSAAPEELDKQKRLADCEALLKAKTMALHTLEGYLDKLERTKAELELGAGFQQSLGSEVEALQKEITGLKE